MARPSKSLLLSCSSPLVSSHRDRVPPTLPGQLTLSSRFQSSGWPSLAPLRLLPERLQGRKYRLVNTRKSREGERRTQAGAAQPPPHGIPAPAQGAARMAPG